MRNAFLIGTTTFLRPVALTDAPLFASWVNDPETRRYLLRRFPISLPEETSWLEKVSRPGPIPTDIVLVVCVKKTGKAIGTIGLHRINWIDRNATTGTVIGSKSARGKGYATDAKMILLRYAFETLQMHKVISHADAGNAASIAYSKRCGYVVEGLSKEEIYRNGIWTDMVNLACFYPSFKKAFQAYMK
jgi:RimJ/RimL family protein N-acetyltransferase